jgi:hypothetical protein
MVVSAPESDAAIMLNHRGKGNVLLFPCCEELQNHHGNRVRCRERLAGLVK